VFASRASFCLNQKTIIFKGTIVIGKNGSASADDSASRPRRCTGLIFSACKSNQFDAIIFGIFHYVFVQSKKPLIAIKKIC